MDIPFIIAQAIGPVTTVLSIWSAQLKNLKLILLFELTINAMVAASYILLGAFSGAYICIAAVLQTTVSFFFASKKKEVPHAVTGVFLLIYVILSAITYKVPMDILPGVCSLAFALAVAQKKPTGYRIYIGINSALWVIYDIAVAAYTMILTHGLLLRSILIALIRYAILKKEEKNADPAP